MTKNMTGRDYMSVHLKRIEKAIIFMVNALPYLQKKQKNNHFVVQSLFYNNY